MGRYTLFSAEHADQCTEGKAAILLLVQEIINSGKPGVIQVLAEAGMRLQDRVLRSTVLDALRQINNPVSLDEIWAAWYTTRHEDLAGFLLEINKPAIAPLQLRVLSQFLLNQTAALLNSEAEIVELLLAAADDTDARIAERAKQVLSNLKNDNAREELCRLVIQRGHPVAQLAALTGGYAPRDARQRALFFLLTEQWDRYMSLDFDVSLLRAVYETGDIALRRKIAEFARRSGWPGYIDAVASQRSSHRLDSLKDAEWEVILSLLGRGQRWEDTWRLALLAPACWSARLIHLLTETNWRPSTADEQDAFPPLAQAATNCLLLGEPATRRVRFQQILNGHTRPIHALTFSPDSQRLASAGADRTIQLWEMPSSDRLIQLEGHSHIIEILAFSPNKQTLASASADRTVRVWQIPQAKPMHILGGHISAVNALAFSPDGKYLVTGDPAGVRLWLPEEGRLIKFLSSTQSPITQVSFSTDNQLLLAGNENHTLTWWHIDELNIPHSLMDRAARWVLFPNSTTLATVSSYGRLRLWQLPEGQLLETLEGHSDGACLGISPDGAFLGASDQTNLRLWRAGQGYQTGLIEAHSQPVTSLLFSPDQHMMATGGQDGMVRLWHLPQGRLLETQAGLTAAVHPIAFSPSGDWFACANDSQIFLWALDNLGSLFKLPVTRLNGEMIDLAERVIKSPGVSDIERAWIEFTLSVAQWLRRYDIEVEEAPHRIHLGEFDIELDG